MGHSERIEIIKKIEALRGSHVICYLTSIRPNAGGNMGDDAVRAFFEHLSLLPERPVDSLDIFICSNGGNGVVPWRLISLFREFAKKIGVLVPYRAYSAATMLALGADEIVMHPFAEMGPIDPTVSNEYNPIDQNTMQRIGISVEDVKAYISFIRDTVGIRHEDELIKAVEILAQKVHPLALGNVERFIAQSRMIARKILLTHMNEETHKHKIDDTIDTLASKLYFHGHPINRREARDELGLKVVDAPPELETLMWDLYKDFEEELKNTEIFDPMGEIYRQVPDPEPFDPTAAIAVPIVPVGAFARSDDKLAIVESGRLSSSFRRTLRFVVVGTGQQGEPLIRSETLTQAWDHLPAPARAPEA
ncbi:hypothetical protein ABE438_16805 [Bosea sp. TWI1241]|uniref:SDH family Clp fold serine proteinase n=1 Tax=Bosea sp. TWI1241 TaxID=3148904 RepID=UPI00320B6913